MNKLTVELNELREQCAIIKKEAFEEAISDLPKFQQVAFKTCIESSNKNPKQRRYSIEWIYECLLMNILNSRLYEHLLKKKILVIPTRNTLQKYIRQIGTVYGFQQSIFDCLKLKA